jgi:hypothetical protein
MNTQINNKNAKLIDAVRANNCDAVKRYLKGL